MEGACGWESSSVEDKSILSSHCVEFLVYGHKKNRLNCSLVYCVLKFSTADAAVLSLAQCSG